MSQARMDTFGGLVIPTEAEYRQRQNLPPGDSAPRQGQRLWCLRHSYHAAGCADCDETARIVQSMQTRHEP